MNATPIERPQARLRESGIRFFDKPVELIELINSHGVEVILTNLGAAIYRIRTPDRDGRLADIVLYCDQMEHQRSQQAYLGATTGRYANRIAHSRFTLDGQEHHLAANEGPHQLHGGPDGFDKRLWFVERGVDENSSYACFDLISADGDQGFPGALTTRVEYRLTDENRLEIDIQAQTTAPTHVNISNHAYFNLSGNLFAGMEQHYVEIHSDRVCEIDRANIPSGRLTAVAGTPLDLRQACHLAPLLESLPAALAPTAGFDHNYVFATAPVPAERAKIRQFESGRTLTLFATQPGLQFYTGNHLAAAQAIGPGGQAYAAHAGLCLEAQHFPDAPNHPDFPTTRLDPKQHYHHQIIYQFGTA